MIIITFNKSKEQVISGIPRYVEITTNIPSTIYYTTDGTLPTPLSNLYTEAVKMPSDSSSVTLSAVAYYFDGYDIIPSPVLSKIYSTNSSDLTRTRYTFFEGIVYSYPGGKDIPLYYDFAGDPSFYIDVPLETLENVQPDRAEDGSPIAPEGQPERVSPEYTGSIIDDSPPLYSSANNPESFRPDAMVITIDGRESAENKPYLNIVNGHLMSLRNSRTSWGGIDYINLGKTNYFSGSALRYNYDRSKNIIVFSYFDSNSNRWIRSIQDLPQQTEERPRPHFSNPHVFKWFTYGRHQS